MLSSSISRNQHFKESGLRYGKSNFVTYGRISVMQCFLKLEDVFSLFRLLYSSTSMVQRLEISRRCTVEVDE